MASDLVERVEKIEANQLVLMEAYNNIVNYYDWAKMDKLRLLELNNGVIDYPNQE